MVGTVIGRNYVGGLVGIDLGGKISVSYAAGTVSGADAVGGLAGCADDGTISDSYYDSQVSGTGVAVGRSDADDCGSKTATDGAEGKTTSALQLPTGYTGIYADWNLDLDGDGSSDDPWDFGASTQYPALKADPNGDGTATW